MTCELTRDQLSATNILVSDAKYIALYGGSRSGKTFLLIRSIIVRALKAPGTNHAILRFRFNHLSASVIQKTFPDVCNLCFPGLFDHIKWNKRDWFAELPNGSRIWFGGLDNKERSEKILGQEHSTLYFNECSQISYSSIITALTRLAEKSELTNKMYADFNPPAKSHWTYKLYVDKKDPLTGNPISNPMDYAFYILNPSGNRQNISDDYIKLLESYPPAQRDRFLYGLFSDDDNAQLWTPEILSSCRIDETPGKLLRVVVAVDPSGSDGGGSDADEIGITVTGLDYKNNGYLLEDLSGSYRPEEWGEIVVNAYHRVGADTIVAERNYGGDMVRAVIQAHDEAANVKLVTASKGKSIRAEPIASRYFKQSIFHVGTFQKLEDQMLNMLTTGYIGVGSPDRLDAAVWGFTELFEDAHMSVTAAASPPPRVKRISRSMRPRA